MDGAGSAQVDTFQDIVGSLPIVTVAKLDLKSKPNNKLGNRERLTVGARVIQSGVGLKDFACLLSN